MVLMEVEKIKRFDNAMELTTFGGKKSNWIIDPKTNKSVPAPMFSRVYNLTSVENQGTFTWHGYNINLVKKYFSKNFRPYVIGKVSKNSKRVKLSGNINW